jgi:7-carboxy-7-deazaguanine synthase
VCITGGEPLLQKSCIELMKQLCDLNYTVSLETSGDISCREVDPRVLKVIDIKTPDSGEGGRFSEENLELADVNTEFKFVICSENDFSWASKYIEENNLTDRARVFFSPAFESVSPKWLAEKILQCQPNARLQLQQHKYIWSPETRGV